MIDASQQLEEIRFEKRCDHLERYVKYKNRQGTVFASVVKSLTLPENICESIGSYMDAYGTNGLDSFLRLLIIQNQRRKLRQCIKQHGSLSICHIINYHQLPPWDRL